MRAQYSEIEQILKFTKRFPEGMKQFVESLVWESSEPLPAFRPRLVGRSRYQHSHGVLWFLEAATLHMYRDSSGTYFAEDPDLLNVVG